MKYFGQIIDQYLNIDWLKSNKKVIHYFGLGFIQLKLSDVERMHFYTPKLSPITPDEDLHNHRYSFNSIILYGVLEQWLYDVIDGKDYLREQESCKEGVETDVQPIPCDIKLNSMHTYSRGCNYTVEDHVFHKVRADECITLIHRCSYAKDFAEVIRPVGAEKVCPFSKKIAEEELWAIVEEMVKKARE